MEKHTLHFFVNGILQSVSYSDIPSSLTFYVCFFAFAIHNFFLKLFEKWEDIQTLNLNWFHLTAFTHRLSHPPLLLHRLIHIGFMSGNHVWFNGAIRMKQKMLDRHLLKKGMFGNNFNFLLFWFFRVYDALWFERCVSDLLFITFLKYVDFNMIWIYKGMRKNIIMNFNIHYIFMVWNMFIHYFVVKKYLSQNSRWRMKLSTWT
jgi:hypothetical protein